MAGNTKLTGFLSGNRIQLERWGKSTIVQLDEKSALAIRAGCFNELPQRPTQRATGALPEFRAKYDASMGRIRVELSPEAAGRLGDFLDISVADNPQAFAMFGEWISQLQEAVQDHKEFHNAAGEPGLEVDVKKDGENG